MNILHISDFHYNGNRREIDKIIPAIIKCIKESNKKVDFILFTGDLVFSGSNKKHFDEASNCLFEEMSNKLFLPKENIIFCPGNHDIDYNQIRYSKESFFKNSIKTNKDLDLIYKGEYKDQYIFNDSLAPLSNYKDFLENYHTSKNDTIKDLYSIHYRIYNDKKIAFVCLFSPWLCNLDSTGGKNDYGNLYIPEALFEDVEKTLEKDVEKKIALIHHPISYLRDFNAYEVENHIYDQFDMLFVGHIHKTSNVTRHNGVNGIYEHVAKASLSNKELLGCTYIENDDIEENIFTIQEITYIKDSNECHFGSPFVASIPIGAEKDEINKLRKKINEKILIEKDNANNLLLLKQEDGGFDFLSTFNTPLIKMSREDSMSQSNSNSLTMNELFSTEDHLVVLGKDKCGKTSFLRRIQLEYLMNYTRYNRIPIFLDAKEEENKVDDNYSLKNLPRNYLGINSKLSEKIINSEQLVLLVDNFKQSTAFANYLFSFIDNHPKALIIAVGEDIISAQYDYSNLKLNGNRDLRVLHFNNLRKKEIIQYTDQQLANEENKMQIQERILKLCKQMELPYNYWTISLFLLIHHKASDTYSKNLFSILDICVDEIFGKKKLLLSNSQVTFVQLKNICAMLARYLFENHEGNIYSATKDVIMFFLKREFAKNKRLTISAEDAFNFFVSCGMLKMRSNGFFVFRLNGFFEYFLAYQMKQSEEFKSLILKDDEKYLAFKNQLEIYSGLQNSDSDFLEEVFSKTSKKCQPLFSKFDTNKDKELLNKIEIPNLLENKLKSITVNEALNSYQKAELEDRMDSNVILNSEVHLIEKIDPNRLDIDVVGRYLSILARVFKNIDDISNSNVNPEQIFRTIIDFYCDYSFFVIEELSQKTEFDIKRESFNSQQEEEAFRILKIMSNFSPLIVQMEFFDGVGHFSMERMVKDEIDRLKEDVENNQYKLFILYFFLFDLSLEKRESLMNEVISFINIPLLRYMMLLKFNYYLAFRSDGNKKLQSILSDKIRKSRRLLDNRVNSTIIEIGISEKKKNSLVNNQINK